MIQTRKYDFLVQPTPQREWIEKRGVLMWLAMFFIEMGAGAFLVSSFFDLSGGMLLGWLVTALLGGGFHLIYLGHPLRFWRMVFSTGWKTSWISRGLIFVVFFLALGLLRMALPLLGFQSVILSFMTGAFALLVVIYVGFLMASVGGIALWNTALLPVLYVIMGVWGGLGLTLLVMLGTGITSEFSTVEELSRIFLIAFIFIVSVYLFTVRYQGSTGKLSVRVIIAGKLAPLFWICVIILGTALPVGVAIAAWTADVSIPETLIFTLILLELLGDLSLRYCILRAGLYAPLVPGNSYV